MKRLRQVLSRMLIVIVAVSQLGAATIPAYAATDEGVDPVITDQTDTEVTSETESTSIEEQTASDDEIPSSDEQEMTGSEELTEEITESADETSEETTEVEGSEEILDKDKVVEEDTEKTELLGDWGEGIAINPAHFPDYYFRIYVKQKYDKDKDNYLSYEETNVTSFILERGPVDNPNQIVEDITGIEYFTRLTSLSIYNTRIEFADLRGIDKLENLTIYSYTESQDKPVDSDTLKLVNLVGCNNLRYLKLPNNTQLTKVKLPASTPDLQYVELDHTGFNTFDDIKKRTSIESLFISGLGLGSIDLSYLKNLETLDCSGNNLTSLNVASCKKLTNLNCSDNNLTEVNVKNNPELKKYDVHNNQLNKLNLQYNTKLTKLDIRDNCLFYADLTNQKDLRQDGVAVQGIGISTANTYTIHVTPDQKTIDLTAIKQCDPFKFSGKFVNYTYPEGVISADGILTIPDALHPVTLRYKCRETEVDAHDISLEFYIRFEVDKQTVPVKSTDQMWFKNATLCVPGGYAVGSSSLTPSDTSPEAFSNIFKISFSNGEWIDTDTKRAMGSGEQFKFWGHYLYHVRFTPNDGYSFDKSNLPPATNFRFYQDGRYIMKGVYSCLDGKGYLHVYAQSTDKYKCFTSGTGSYTAADGSSITVPELCSLGVTSQDKDGKAVIKVSNFAMSYLSENADLLPAYWVKISENDPSLASKHNKWVKMDDSPMTFEDFSNGSHVVYMYAGSSDPSSDSKSFYQKSVKVQAYWTVTYQYAGLGSTAYGSLKDYNYSERIPAESIANEPDPAKIADTGWTVTGWYLDSLYTNQYNFDTDLTKDNTILYAKLEEKPNTMVHFDRNGKSDANTVNWPGDQRVAIGSKAKRPSDPETIASDNDVFYGWYADPECTKEYDFNRTIDTETTLYAKWMDVSMVGWFTVKMQMPNEKFPAYSSLEYLTVSTQYVEMGDCAKIPDGNFDYTDRYGRKNIFKYWKIQEPSGQRGKVFDFYSPLYDDYVLVPEYVTEAEAEDFYAYFNEEDNAALSFNEDKNRYEHVYSGAAYCPGVEVRSAGQVLIPGVDYSIKYSNNTNVDKKGKPATVTITGKGRHKGKTTLQFYILPVNLADKYEPEYFSTPDPQDNYGTWCVRIPEICVQSGSKIKPVIYYGHKTLGSNDYKLSNTGKVKEDTSVTIWGKGNYTGMISNLPVKVLSKEDMKAKSLKVTITANKTYNGEDQELTVRTSETEPAELTVRNANGDLLRENVDFRVAYDSNYNAGAAKVIVSPVEGSGYIGSVNRTFKIKPRKNADLTANVIGDITYDPEEGVVVPSEGNISVSDKELGELTFGSDYTVKFTNNINAGTAKYKITLGNNFRGHKAMTGSFTIKPYSLGGIEVRCADMVYSKKNRYQSVPIVTYNGSHLKGKTISNKDYTVKYYTVIGGETKEITGQKIELAESETSKRIKAVITGKHNLTADVTAETYYYVTRAPKEKINLTKARIVAKGTNKAIPKQVYTGSSIMPKIDVQIKEGKKWVVVDPSNYTVVYANCLSTGKATIYVNGKNDAVGSKKANFKILAKSLTEFLLNPIF